MQYINPKEQNLLGRLLLHIKENRQTKLKSIYNTKNAEEKNQWGLTKQKWTDEQPNIVIEKLQY